MRSIMHDPMLFGPKYCIMTVFFKGAGFGENKVNVKVHFYLKVC